MPRLRFRVAFLALLPALANAQAGSGVFTGTVRDTTQRPIVGADISFPDLALSTRANDRGEFRLTGIPAGAQRVLVRSIGYSLTDETITFADGQTVERHVVLSRVIILDSVVTTGARYRDPDMIDFEENRKLGLGHFITPTEMSKQEGRTMPAILQQFAAIHIVHGLNGAAWAASARGPRSFGGGCPKLEDAYRQPSDSCNYCYAQVFLDNTLLSQTEYPNLAKLIPAETEAIEYYSGGAETPQKYSVLNSQCGVVVLHSRRPP